MRTFLLDDSFSLSLAAVCSGVLPGIDLGREGDLVSLGRPDRAGDVDRQLGQLARLAAVDRQEPDLVRAAAVRDEGDRLAVGAPARVVVGAGRGRQLLGLAAASSGRARDCCSSCRWHGRARRPRRRPALPSGESWGSADALDRQQVVDCHRPAGGPRGEAAIIMSKSAEAVAWCRSW